MSHKIVSIVILFLLLGCSSKLGVSIVRPLLVQMPNFDDVEVLRSIMMFDSLEFDSFFQGKGIVKLEDSIGNSFKYHYYVQSDTISFISERYTYYKTDSFLIKRIYTFEVPYGPLDSFKPVLCRAGDVTNIDSTESFKVFTTTLFLSKDSTIFVLGDEFSTTANTL